MTCSPSHLLSYTQRTHTQCTCANNVLLYDIVHDIVLGSICICLFVFVDNHTTNTKTNATTKTKINSTNTPQNHIHLTHNVHVHVLDSICRQPHQNQQYQHVQNHIHWTRSAVWKLRKSDLKISPSVSNLVNRHVHMHIPESMYRMYMFLVFSLQFQIW